MGTAHSTYDNDPYVHAHDTASAQVFAPPARAPRESEGFRFLDLPAELRTEVYGYLVVANKIFYSPLATELRDGGSFKDHERYRKPHLGILRACKQTYKEALGVYFKMNLFVLPNDYLYWSPLPMSKSKDTILRQNRPLFSVVGFQKIKNISIQFTHRSGFPLAAGAAHWAGLKSKGIDFAALTQPQRLDWTHKMGKEAMLRFCNWQLRGLEKFFTTLSYLEMGFISAYCSTGCCRIVDFDFKFLAKLRPKTIRLLGLRPGEKELLVAEMKKAFDGQELDAVGITLIDEDAPDPWAISDVSNEPGTT